MAQKINLHCGKTVHEYTHAISAKLSILNRISAAFDLTPTLLVSLNDWTSALLLLIRSDCYEAEAYGDAAARQRFDHNKDLALNWVTSTGTILAQHDRLIQGHAGTPQEKATAKKDLEDNNKKATANKLATKQGSPPRRIDSVDYSSVALPDLLSLSAVLDDHLQKTKLQVNTATP